MKSDLARDTSWVGCCHPVLNYPFHSIDLLFCGCCGRGIQQYFQIQSTTTYHHRRDDASIVRQRVEMHPVLHLKKEAHSYTVSRTFANDFCTIKRSCTCTAERPNRCYLGASFNRASALAGNVCVRSTSAAPLYSFGLGSTEARPESL